MSLGYNSRLSQVGLGKADPGSIPIYKGLVLSLSLPSLPLVLSSFSPVGHGGTKTRTAEDTIVAQIQPRNSTPLQSSAISRSMVSAETADWGANVLAREGMQSSLGASTKKLMEGGLPHEGLGRLSISGRLSLTQPPTTPVTWERHATLNLAGSTPLADGEDGKKNTDIPPATTRSELVKDRFVSVERTVTSSIPEFKGSLVTADAGAGRLGAAPPLQPSEVGQGRTTGLPASSVPSGLPFNAIDGSLGASSGNIPQLIRTLVEKSIADAMSEIKNDIQNLHVELIKQSLAQQNALHQIVANMPDMYKKLADDYRILHEENERLKIRLNLEK